MRAFGAMGSGVVLLSVLAGCSAQVGGPEDVAQAEGAIQPQLNAGGLSATLFKSPAGLAGCQAAELVSQVEVKGVALATYPPQFSYTAQLSSFYRACPGIPVPLAYMVGPVVSVEKLDLGCGSVLYRGDLPTGGKLEIFDHRDARRGWRCGTPSANPVIVRNQGQLSYAVSTAAACETILGEATCASRSDCSAVRIYYGGGPVPAAAEETEVPHDATARPAFTCVTNPP